MICLYGAGAGTAGNLPKETYKIEIWMGRRRRNLRVGVGGSHAILFLYVVFKVILMLGSFGFCISAIQYKWVFDLYSLTRTH